MSSGASEKEEVKYNLDKRTQRLVDSAEFKNALNQLRAKVHTPVQARPVCDGCLKLCASNAILAQVAAEGPAFLRQESKSMSNSSLWRNALCNVHLSSCLTRRANNPDPVTAPSSEKKVQVVVRKRPLFDYEVVTKGQYDVVTAVHDDRNGTSGMVVSQCRQRIVPRRGIVRELGILPFTLR